jgi:hypothetical protein
MCIRQHRRPLEAGRLLAIRPFVPAAVLAAALAHAPLAAQGSVKTTAPDTQMTNMPGMRMPGMQMAAGPLGIPATREGSGTSWLPDASPHTGVHFGSGTWEFAVHGSEFVQYDQQYGGDRGASQFGALGWIMGMASHPIGDGRLTFRAMFSADPWTVTYEGYPEILQSGESYNGEPLHDRQHPHNLFGEIAAIYATPVTHDVAVQLYAAPVGEPALGPVAFSHRPSASSDPFAPLGHHWQDATHTSFGVLTAGIFSHTVMLEGSIFNGREPDQNRAGFNYTGHSPTLDSYSGRLSINPVAAWTFSAWYSYLKSPEQLEPTVSQHRMGASALNEQPLGTAGELSTALIYGANLYSNEPQLSNSVLLESNANLDGWNTVYTRLEYVNKSPTDLDVPVPPPPAASTFNIASLSLGYLREISGLTRYGSIAAGVLGTIDAIPSTLFTTYGTRTPGGFAVYVLVRVGNPRSGM